MFLFRKKSKVQGSGGGVGGCCGGAEAKGASGSKGGGCCSGAESQDKSGDCCGGSAETTARPLPDSTEVKKKITIDFLYLDLTVCTRCVGTGDTLDHALAEVQEILNAAGFAATVNKVRINSEDLARQYRFVSSPTLRINGRDISGELKESRCESCGDLCGEDVDCRVWVYQGQEYTQPPKAMIINAILSAVYGNPEASPGDPSASPGDPPAPDEAASRDAQQPYVLPENLARFFQAVKNRKG